MAKHQSLHKGRRSATKSRRVVPGDSPKKKHRRVDGAQTLTTIREITSALEAAATLGEGFDSQLGEKLGELLPISNSGPTASMRQLVADLCARKVLPISVRWDPRAPWSSGVGILKAYGRLPMLSRGRWLGERN